MNIGDIKHVTFELSLGQTEQKNEKKQEVDMLINGLFVGKVPLIENKGILRGLFGDRVKVKVTVTKMEERNGKNVKTSKEKEMSVAQSKLNEINAEINQLVSLASHCTNKAESIDHYILEYSKYLNKINPEKYKVLPQQKLSDLSHEEKNDAIQTLLRIKRHLGELSDQPSFRGKIPAHVLGRVTDLLAYIGREHPVDVTDLTFERSSLCTKPEGARRGSEILHLTYSHQRKGNEPVGFAFDRVETAEGYVYYESEIQGAIDDLKKFKEDTKNCLNESEAIDRHLSKTSHWLASTLPSREFNPDHIQTGFISRSHSLENLKGAEDLLKTIRRRIENLIAENERPVGLLEEIEKRIDMVEQRLRFLKDVNPETLLFQEALDEWETAIANQTLDIAHPDFSMDLPSQESQAIFRIVDKLPKTSKPVKPLSSSTTLCCAWGAYEGADRTTIQRKENPSNAFQTGGNVDFACVIPGRSAYLMCDGVGHNYMLKTGGAMKFVQMKAMQGLLKVMAEENLKSDNPAATLPTFLETTFKEGQMLPSNWEEIFNDAAKAAIAEYESKREAEIEVLHSSLALLRGRLEQMTAEGVNQNDLALINFQIQKKESELNLIAGFTAPDGYIQRPNSIDFDTFINSGNTKDAIAEINKTTKPINMIHNYFEMIGKSTTMTTAEVVEDNRGQKFLVSTSIGDSSLMGIHIDQEGRLKEATVLAGKNSDDKNKAHEATEFGSTIGNQQNRCIKLPQGGFLIMVGLTDGVQEALTNGNPNPEKVNKKALGNDKKERELNLAVVGALVKQNINEGVINLEKLKLDILAHGCVSMRGAQFDPGSIDDCAVSLTVVNLN